MKTLIVLILAITSILAAPAIVKSKTASSTSATATTSTSTDAPAVTILKQIHQVNDDGTYTFGYENTDGTFRAENKDANGLVTGKYGYFDQNGQLQVLDYVAGSGQSGKSVGYVPTGESQQLPALLTARTDEEDATPTDPRALDFQYSSVDDDKDGMPDSSPVQRVQDVAVPTTTKKPATPIIIQRTQSIRTETNKKTSTAAAIAQRIQDAVNVETTKQPTSETTTMSSLAQRIQIFQAARSTTTSTTTTAVPTIRSTPAPVTTTSTSTTTTVSPLPSTTTTTTTTTTPSPPPLIVARIADSVSVDSVAEDTPTNAAPVIQPAVVTTPVTVNDQPTVVQLVSPQQFQVVQQRIVNPQHQLIQLRPSVSTTSILSNSAVGFSRMEQFLRDLQIQRLTNINDPNQQFFVVDPSNPQQSQFVFLDSDRATDSLPSYVLGRII